MAIPTPQTIFTRDILGNYVCNALTEAQASGPFDVIIIGGGTFGLALAQDLFFRSKRFEAILETLAMNHRGHLFYYKISFF